MLLVVALLAAPTQALAENRFATVETTIYDKGRLVLVSLTATAGIQPNSDNYYVFSGYAMPTDNNRIVSVRVSVPQKIDIPDIATISNAQYKVQQLFQFKPDISG